MSTPGDYEGKTDEELLGMIWGMARDNPTGVAVERVLQVRIGRRQTEAANALVGATKKLATATWVLAATTFLMLLTAAAQVYLTWMGTE